MTKPIRHEDYISQLHQKIESLAPIYGINPRGKAPAEWVINYRPEATEDQRKSAEAELRSFQYKPEAPPVDPRKLAKLLIQKGLTTQEEIDSLRIM